MIRWANPRDADALALVFHAAVRDGPSPYTEAQRAAWSPEPRSGDPWSARLAGLDTAVIERSGAITGFMSLEPPEYIDLAFIVPGARGQGGFRRLYDRIEAHARAQGAARLRTHASLMAEPAFHAMGFRVITRQSIDRAGQSIDRALMEKPLT
ncbi:GNAT family N-acetyltransferase [Sulfitobacter sabulilitoris]|uniref:GNAT family N-acetyltransferase n=1 Tax=Sulfitobacter sabulilitoris TaxID=2562655 RepID=A0A5S3PHJ1_9RHOB|nr:GNAT family N-acetyltransferase [Sulfitobacter sabulilitoris]TMM52801.1 GNAT family N-acetyltransferase [Sulfitobacter sabulilitoris]